MSNHAWTLTANFIFFMADWLINLISITGFLGSLASCVGLWFSFAQLKKMTDATNAATSATNQAVAKLNREYSIAELARCTEIFQRVRICICYDSYKSAELLFSDIRFRTQELVHVPQIIALIDNKLIGSVLQCFDKDIIKLGSHDLDNPLSQRDKDILYKHINDLAVHLKDVESKLKYTRQNVC